jgi:hypothetical protein
MKDDANQIVELTEQEDLMDTLGLEGEEEKKLIELVEGGADEDEATDLLRDDMLDPATENPYDNENPL